MELADSISSVIAGYDVRITSTSRTVSKQLEIILDPKYRDNYKPIKRRFMSSFPKLKELPNSSKQLDPQQKKWWIRNINAQAGLPKGFAHIGGNAVDVAVANLTLDQKKKLKAAIEVEGYGVFLEFVKKGFKAKFNVPLAGANVFHIYRKN